MRFPVLFLLLSAMAAVLTRFLPSTSAISTSPRDAHSALPLAAVADFRREAEVAVFRNTPSKAGQHEMASGKVSSLKRLRRKRERSSEEIIALGSNSRLEEIANQGVIERANDPVMEVSEEPSGKTKYLNEKSGNQERSAGKGGGGEKNGVTFPTVPTSKNGRKENNTQPTNDDTEDKRKKNKLRPLGDFATAADNRKQKLLSKTTRKTSSRRFPHRLILTSSVSKDGHTRHGLHLSYRPKSDSLRKKTRETKGPLPSRWPSKRLKSLSPETEVAIEVTGVVADGLLRDFEPPHCLQGRPSDAKADDYDDVELKVSATFKGSHPSLPPSRDGCSCRRMRCHRRRRNRLRGLRRRNRKTSSLRVHIPHGRAVRSSGVTTRQIPSSMKYFCEDYVLSRPSEMFEVLCLPRHGHDSTARESNPPLQYPGREYPGTRSLRHNKKHPLPSETTATLSPQPGQPEGDVSVLSGSLAGLPRSEGGKDETASRSRQRVTSSSHDLSNNFPGVRPFAEAVPTSVLEKDGLDHDTEKPDDFAHGQDLTEGQDDRFPGRLTSCRTNEDGLPSRRPEGVWTGSKEGEISFLADVSDDDASLLTVTPQSIKPSSPSSPRSETPPPVVVGETTPIAINSREVTSYPDVPGKAIFPFVSSNEATPSVVTAGEVIPTFIVSREQTPQGKVTVVVEKRNTDLSINQDLQALAQLLMRRSYQRHHHHVHTIRAELRDRGKRDVTNDHVMTSSGQAASAAI